VRYVPPLLLFTVPGDLVSAGTTTEGMFTICISPLTTNKATATVPQSSNY
jgi:hypothetical protein